MIKPAHLGIHGYIGSDGSACGYQNGQAYHIIQWEEAEDEQGNQGNEKQPGCRYDSSLNSDGTCLDKPHAMRCRLPTPFADVLS